MDNHCPFCDTTELVISNDLAYVRYDKYPISPGHLLVVPYRHVVDYFDTTFEEKQALLKLVDKGKQLLDEEHSPDGYNIGINCGVVAGQTVMHLHIHLIPRYHGDVDEPRGGIRWIFPDKVDYWTEK